MIRQRLIAALLAISAPGAAGAQTARGCTLQELTDPPRQVLRCEDGLVAETKRGADAVLGDSNGDGRPDRAIVTRGGVLIDLPARRRGGFQVLTPHAIASVRGTVYAVEAGAGSTAVFVQQGLVSVTRRDGSEGVTLGPGQGVDVDPSKPLEVRRWPRERALDFLARFGR
jgi:hypothetical protein